ncbi:hypothetical protein MCA2688 [Methylococcus capsulatus str. Bath]|uniref:Uncharacterized protein n=1 Tax=Methylococcus capsulatus (strain ATCC 33009 / NCIMB 11132 / Bath) TaxID=243233 RepID=Q603V8_METCA|nr:hypothetical protein MCA2688 [Methylococcus capsulatus str. Bath]
MPPPPTNQPVSVGPRWPRLWHKNDTNLPQADEADRLTAGYGTHECRRFRRGIFDDLSPLAVDLALRYAKTAERFSFRQANLELLEIHERLVIHDLNLSSDTQDLQEAAKGNPPGIRGDQK